MCVPGAYNFPYCEGELVVGLPVWSVVCTVHSQRSAQVCTQGLCSVAVFCVLCAF